MTMSKSNAGHNQGSPKNGSGTEQYEQRQYQFGGEFVISSSRAAGAWISATYPVDITEAR